jgi:hypothetical protein
MKTYAYICPKQSWDKEEEEVKLEENTILVGSKEFKVDGIVKEETDYKELVQDFVDETN